MAATGFYKKKLEEQRKQQAIWDAETAASVKRGEEINKQIAYRNNRRHQVVPRIDLTSQSDGASVVPPYTGTGTSASFGNNSTGTSASITTPSQLPSIGLAHPWGTEMLAESGTGTLDHLAPTAVAGNIAGTIVDHAGNVVSKVGEGVSNAFDWAVETGGEFTEAFTGSNDPDYGKKTIVPNLPTRPTTQKDVEAYSRTPMAANSTTRKGVDTVPKVKVDKGSLTAEAERQNAEVEARVNSILPVDGKTDTAVPTTEADTKVPKNEVEVAKPFVMPGPSTIDVDKKEALIKEVEQSDAGKDLPEGTSLDLKKGVITDAEGNKLDVDPIQVKGVFDKAATAFGDIFSAGDLKRMTLYTLGGLLSGGSLKGSFQWAGLKVMEEQTATKAGEAAIAAKALDNENLGIRDARLQGYSEKTALTRTQAAAVAAKNLAGTNATSAQIKAEADRVWRVADQNAKIEAARVKAVNDRSQSAITAYAKLLKEQKEQGVPTGDRKRYVINGGDYNGQTIPAVEYSLIGGGKGWFMEVPDGKGGSYPVPQSSFEREMGGNTTMHVFGTADTNAGKAKVLTDFVDNVVKKNIADIWEANELDPKASTTLASSIVPYMNLMGYEMNNPEVRAEAIYAFNLAAENAAKDAKFNKVDVKNLGPYVAKMMISTAVKAPGTGVWGIKGSGDGSSGKDVDVKKIEQLAKVVMEESGKDWGKAKVGFQDYYQTFSDGRKDGLIKDVVLNPGENQFAVWLANKLDVKFK